MREHYAKFGDLDDRSLDFSSIRKEEFDQYTWDKLIKNGDFK